MSLWRVRLLYRERISSVSFLFRNARDTRTLALLLAQERHDGRIGKLLVDARLRVSRPGERDVDFRAGQLIRDRHRHRIVFLNRIEEAPLSRLLVLVPVEFQDQRLDDRLERGDPPARFVLFHLVAPVFRQVRAMADSILPLLGILTGGAVVSGFLISFRKASMYGWSSDHLQTRLMIVLRAFSFLVMA